MWSQKLFEQFIVNDVQVIRLHVDRVIIYVVLKKIKNASAITELKEKNCTINNRPVSGTKILII